MDNWDEGQKDALDGLVAEFPRIFAERRPAGSYVPPGWVSLVRELLVKIDKALAPGQAIEVLQIKEKFGGLRFYWSLGEEKILIADIHKPDGLLRLNVKPKEPSEAFGLIDGFVEHAEQASLATCERCGRPGILERSGWWRVSCQACRCWRAK